MPGSQWLVRVTLVGRLGDGAGMLRPRQYIMIEYWSISPHEEEKMPFYANEESHK